MRTLTRDEADLKLVWQVLTEELDLVKPWRYRDRYYQWVLDAEMFAMIRRLESPSSAAAVAFWGPPPSNEPMTLLGYPVEIRDGVEGIRLEVVGV